MLARFREALHPTPKLHELSFASLEQLLREGRYEDILVSYACQHGGGGIIPIGSSNLDHHREAIQKHIGHGDEVKISFWGSQPLVHSGSVLAITSKQTAEYKLIA